MTSDNGCKAESPHVYHACVVRPVTLGHWVSWVIERSRVSGPFRLHGLGMGRADHEGVEAQGTDSTVNVRMEKKCIEGRGDGETAHGGHEGRTPPYYGYMYVGI